MKRRILSIVLCLTMLLSCVTCLSAVTVSSATVSVSQVNATQNQLNMVARANYMYNATWVCQKTVSGWGGTFYAGSTYHVPYGQPIYSGSYIGFKNGNTLDDSTIDTYLAAAADANSIFYTGQSYYTGSKAPYYATDCSGYVSWCWGVSRKTTASIPNVSTNLGMATASNNYNLQLGDALNSKSAGHVVLVTGLTYDASGTITRIEITEQTPPQLKRTYYTPTTLGNKYGAKYSIQRYSGTVPAAPATQPVGTSPQGSFDLATGSVGSVTIAGWAFDKDETSKSLELYVNVGGPVFTANSESFIITADKARTDVNNIYGCGDYHGFEETIGTSLSGEQPVYVYAYDNNGNCENTLLGYKTVYITPDTENPMVGEVTLVSSNENGYTLSCSVSDNGYISHVYFPTYIDVGDNAIWYEGTVKDGVATCTIPIADFDNYNGTYYTDVYAYDSAGNVGGKGGFYTDFHLPESCLDEITESDGILHIRGWAFDKDAIDESLGVHVYVGGTPGTSGVEGHEIVADKLRDDVDAIYGCGLNHGFEADIKTALTGTQNVYVYAINKGNGGNVLIGSKTVTISDDTVAPTVDNVNIASSTMDSFTVSCDVADNRKVHEVNMAVWSETSENPTWYSMTVENGVATATVPISDFADENGNYIIHIYAYDGNGNKVGYPYETTFNNPQGSFDSVEDMGGAIHLKGWAFDADNVDEALELHVYVGGPSGSEEAELHKIKADTFRDDIDALFGSGSNHGFDSIITTDLRGEQPVYVYALNVGNGGNVFLGSITVTITEPIYGDVDLDGEITVMDATLIQKHCAKLSELTGVALNNADTTKDEVISVFDATTIQMYLAGIIEEMCC